MCIRDRSAEPGDCAWIFDDAIAAGDAYVDRDACLRGDAIACGSAYVSKGSVMSGHSHAEDNAYLRGASMTGKALASGNAQIIHDPHTMGTPIPVSYTHLAEAGTQALVG